MSKWFKIGLASLVVFAAVAALISGAALAQDNTTPVPDNRAPLPGGHGFNRGLGEEVGLEAAAQALGMTVDELSTQLWGGKTLADLAAEKGIDLATLQETVQAAVEAARETEMRAAIDQAVQDATITQEHADWLLEGLEKGFLMDGFGPGFGPEMRGGHGHGPKGFGIPGAAPQANPSSGF